MRDLEFRIGTHNPNLLEGLSIKTEKNVGYSGYEQDYNLGQTTALRH
jgi:hypothetical protein